MTIETLSIPARDGFPLGATAYQPETNPTRTTISIHSATAVPQRFYRTLAGYLAQHGYRVVTYDYRGTGASRPASSRGFKTRACDWALQDMAGVVDWVRSTDRPQRHFLIGHSIGGQLVGLLPNGHLIDAMMGAYPHVTRRHVRPADIGRPGIGHFGYFRPGAERLWQAAVDWLEGVVPLAPGDGSVQSASLRR